MERSFRNEKRPDSSKIVMFPRMKCDTYVLKFENRRLLILERMDCHSVCLKTCREHRGEGVSSHALRVSARVGGRYCG